MYDSKAATSIFSCTQTLYTGPFFSSCFFGPQKPQINSQIKFNKPQVKICVGSFQPFFFTIQQLYQLKVLQVKSTVH